MVTKKPKGLGRGLEALLGPKVPESTLDFASATGTSPGLPSTLLVADPIKTQGIMQPILVRLLKDGLNQGKYEIIAGERRVRAANLAGLDSVPVLVRDVPDEAAATMSLIENIQREDLN